MEWSEIVLRCQEHFPATRRREPFTAIRVSFDYRNSATDREFLEEAIESGQDLARKVNPGAANDASASREQVRVIHHCVAGMIAERLWRRYLNREMPIVSETPFQNASAQIDLIVENTGQTIEVRSSMVRNGIPFAICHPDYQFDILGPYANAYKPGEVQKDYYIRTLFHIGKGERLPDRAYRSGFDVWLVGGATWSMMADNNVAFVKMLRPDEDVDRDEPTEYRVIPFSKALDTARIYAELTEIARAR